MLGDKPRKIREGFVTSLVFPVRVGSVGLPGVMSKKSSTVWQRVLKEYTVDGFEN